MGYGQVITLLDGVSSDQDGAAVDVIGADEFTVFVIASSGLNTGAGDTFTINIQGSPDGTNWVDVSLGEEAPGTTDVVIDQGDVEQADGSTGAYVAEMSWSGHPSARLRASLSSFNDAADEDLTVTVKLVASYR